MQDNHLNSPMFENVLMVKYTVTLKSMQFPKIN